MTDDTGQRLRDAAPAPSTPVDVDGLWRRARRQRRTARVVAGTGGVAASVVAAAVIAGLPGPGIGIDVADRPGGCPVTDATEDPFTPPAPFPSEPPIEDAAWYGTPELWTVVHLDPSVPRKSVWWSVDLEGGDAEPEPDISVVHERLDDPGTEPVVLDGPGTNAYTDVDGRFVIAGREPTEPGCWRATATYRGASLSHVYLVTAAGSGAAPATVTGPTLLSAHSTVPFPWYGTIAAAGPDRWCLTPALRTTAAIDTAPGEPCEHLLVPDPPRGSRALTHAGTRTGPDGATLRWGIVPLHLAERGQLSVTRADGTEVDWQAVRGGTVPFGVWFAGTTGEPPATVAVTVDDEVVETVTITD